MGDVFGRGFCLYDFGPQRIARENDLLRTAKMVGCFRKARAERKGMGQSTSSSAGDHILLKKNDRHLTSSGRVADGKTRKPSQPNDGRRFPLADHLSCLHPVGKVALQKFQRMSLDTRHRWHIEWERIEAGFGKD